MIHSYIDRLRTHLHLSPSEEEEVVRELRAHMEDRLAELERTGLGREEAERALLHRFDQPQMLARRFQEAHIQTSWHDASIAAAAFLLASALFATHLWSQPIAFLGVASIIVGVTLYGVWQGRPAWFYAWAGLALTLLSLCGYIAFVQMDRAVRLLLDGGFDALSMVGLAGAALYFPVALVLLASSIRSACRRDWLNASLMLSPSAPVVFWLASLHQSGGVLNAGSAVAGADNALAATFLAMALAAAIFIRARTRGAKVATLVATSVLMLLVFSSVYDLQPSLLDLTVRTLLLLGFIFSPAALDAVASRPTHSAASHE